MTILNTNMDSLVGLLNLRHTENDIATSISRLTTGLKINKSSDDPSGLAIANKMESLIRGYRQATNNAEDASSLVQTAYSVLDETNEMLIRMRDLSLRVMNQATLTASEISTINAEFDDLRDEITRKGNAATFNSKNLLDGTFVNGLVAHIGADNSVNDQLTIQIATMIADTIASATADLVNVELSDYAGIGALTHAGSAVDILDRSIEYLSDVQVSLSVQEFRLGSIVNDLSAQEINTIAARSNITDADMASEISHFAKLQILAQAGTAVLAQSNNIQQRVVNMLDDL